MKLPDTKWFIIEVGDDPGDEHREGPFDTFVQAVGHIHITGKYKYYTSNRNGLQKADKTDIWKNIYNLYWWNGQISSLFIIEVLDTINSPTYRKDILPRLKLCR